MRGWWILSDTAWEKADNLLMQALKTQSIPANDVPKGLITFSRMSQIESNTDWTIYWPNISLSIVRYYQSGCK
jgi:hypothetical protein